MALQHLFPSSRRRVESIRLLGFDPAVSSAAMAPSSSSNWAMAPPYHYHGPPPQKEQAAPAAEDETGAGSVGFQPRSLWIGGLLNWMDENYLYSCFTRSPELVSVVIKRNKETRQSEGFGFLNFADHATADQILQSYNGQKMPNSDRDFKLNWVIRAAPEKPAKPAEDDHAIYAGDWPLMLQTSCYTMCSRIAIHQLLMQLLYGMVLLDPQKAMGLFCLEMLMNADKR
ncbi:hypothetical protein ACQ4PT_055075 [Festuca glaucescens]